MRIALLADGALAAPLLAFLASQGRLAGVAWGPSDPACRDWAASTCAAAGIACTRVGGGGDLGPWLDGADPDLGLAFGCPWKLPAEVLARPRFGWVNLHGGPLPAYRGPQPVFWQIRNREAASALVAHRMDEGLDTGPIVAELPVPIGPDCTHGNLTAAFGMAAPTLLATLLQGLDSEGEALLARARPQQGEGRTWPRPGAGDVQVRWNAMGAAEVRALVLACNPWNSGAWTSLQGQPLRLVEVSAAGPLGGAPGTLQAGPEGRLAVACADGQGLRLEVLRLETGFYGARQLPSLGLRPGLRFD